LKTSFLSSCLIPHYFLTWMLSSVISQKNQMDSNIHVQDQPFPEVLLKLTHIEKSFSGVRVLDDVSFDLKKGEVHVLAGENGAGKTTLIKIISGVHTDFKGEIILNGHPIRLHSPSHASRHGISAIHQEMSLVNCMSVRDNIFLGREKTGFLGKMDFSGEKEMCRSILERLGIDIDISKPLGLYPLSIKQMIEIAKALVYKSNIIIMDEPTSALNAVEAAKLFQIIRDLKESGHGIVFISHRLEEIYKIADRISVLRDGKYIGTSSADKLPSNKLVKWMVGRELTEQFPQRKREKEKKGRTLLSVEKISLVDPEEKQIFPEQSISFSVRAGEILGIAGLQGSGKSLLLNTLFGTNRKVGRGQIHLKGKKHTVSSPRKSIHQGIALLTNDRKYTGLISNMSVKENMTLASLSKFSKWGWIQKKKEKNAVCESFKAFNIKAHSIYQLVSTLSGGNQQKVVLAKWLETKPDILLLDEPTIGVDVAAKHEIYKLMNNWSCEGLAQILITSELPELLALSDRIIVLHRGRITAEFDRNEATQEKILQSAMGE
jgi:ribose transport system ATP-binding protein